MGLLFGSHRRELTLEGVGVRPRSARAKSVRRADSHASDVKWACLRLRADLVSTTPLDVFRERDGLLFEVDKPPVLKSPDGKIDVTEWLYSTQFDLDDVGNTFGLIKQKTALGYPSIIELVPVESVTVRVKDGQVSYQFGSEIIPSEMVWHERQFTTSGSPMGLSPTAHAALTLSGYLNAAEFAADWFAGRAIPAAHLRNAEKRLNKLEAAEVKQSFIDTVATGDVFVTGSDWEYSVLGAKASESAFLDMLKASAPAQCRFYGVPADVVDVEVATKSMTYASITQRNLQLLILNMGPAFVRRERTFSNLLVPRGQVVKFTTDAILRMDPAARGESMDKAIASKRLTVTEARGLDNRPPLTDEQIAEFDRLFPQRTPTQPQGVPSG